MTFDDLVDDEEGEDRADEETDDDDDGDDDEDDDEEDRGGVAVAACVAAVAGVEAGAAAVAEVETSIATTRLVVMHVARVVPTPITQAIAWAPVPVRIVVIVSVVIARTAPNPPAISSIVVGVSMGGGIVYAFETTGNATGEDTYHEEEHDKSPEPYPTIPDIIIIQKW